MPYRTAAVRFRLLLDYPCNQPDTILSIFWGAGRIMLACFGCSAAPLTKDANSDNVKKEDIKVLVNVDKHPKVR